MKSNQNNMNPGLAILIGCSAVMLGYTLIFIGVFPRKSKKQKCMETMSRYLENMQRLNIHPEDIDEELSKIKDCEELGKINKDLEKAINKYQL